jgi:hypothetical protein
MRVCVLCINGHEMCTALAATTKKEFICPMYKKQVSLPDILLLHFMLLFSFQIYISLNNTALIFSTI